MSQVNFDVRVATQPDWIGIVGDPVGQVRAPALMNSLFERAGLHTRVVPLHVTSQQIAAFLATAPSIKNLKGLIVTVPHKVATAALMTRLLPAAEQAGSVNAVRFAICGELEGDMCDGLGFVSGLLARGIELAGRDVYLHGAGGVGAAIAMSLLGARIARISIFDIDGKRALALVERCRQLFPEIRVTQATGPSPSANLFVNASPVGMRDGDSLPFQPPSGAEGAVVADAVMRGRPSALVTAAQSLGCIGVPGEALLEGQIPLLLEFFGIHI